VAASGLFLAMCLAVVVAIFSILIHQDNQPKFSNRDPINILRDQLKTADPQSPRALRIRATIAKLSGNHKSWWNENENPGAFIRALSEIKTAKNGRKYPANYRQIELDKAKDFKRVHNLRLKELPWISRGPGNVSGRGRSMAVDPSDPSGNTWFVATVGGGVWKTTDAGNTWEFKTPPAQTIEGFASETTTVCEEVMKSSKIHFELIGIELQDSAKLVVFQTPVAPTV